MTEPIASVAVEARETNAEYHADLSHYSHSMLESYIKNPGDFRDIYITGSRAPDPPTEPMQFGSAVHMAVLENVDIPEHYTILNPPINKKTGKPFGIQTKAYESFFQLLDPAGDYLTLQQCDAIQAINKNIHAHRDAMILLGVGGESEVAVRWIREDGTRCKAKFDRIVSPGVYGGVRLIPDLKTASDPTPDGFTKAIVKYGYHRQAAWYLDYFADDPIPTEFPFVVVGSSEPHDVYVHELDEYAIETGRRENAEILRRIKESKKTGVWTHPEQRQVNTISLPKFYREIQEPEE